MSKRNLGILLGVILVLVLILVSKGVFKPEEKEISTLNRIDLQYEWSKIEKSDIPSIIIFSYDADCCASTREFFDKYNTQVLNLTKEYREKFNVLFINTGLLDKEDEGLLVNIAQTNNVSQLPSIALLDKEGKSYKVIEGIFDENEVKKILDGMVK